ncbi:helicase associated domain-containing protein [Streptomyces sp. NPDC001816]|uniref:helicase associated domain-containing protein n=1 Tax=Streptomyces sp. NPDC001816 TaxID=3364612 RepID=UPI00368516B0
MEWQRRFHLTRQHLEADGTLPTAPGDVLHQGEDLGRWVHTQRLGFDELTAVQQWMCEHILGMTPAGEDEKPKPRRSQADKWSLNVAAARQYYQREGHLRVPRKHTEQIIVGGGGEDGDGQDREQREEREEREIKLGAWINNQRSRAATLTTERIEQLSAIGMRWT